MAKFAKLSLEEHHHERNLNTSAGVFLGNKVGRGADARALRLLVVEIKRLVPAIERQDDPIATIEGPKATEVAERIAEGPHVFAGLTHL